MIIFDAVKDNPVTSMVFKPFRFDQGKFCTFILNLFIN